ncbi:hypothetical protein C900_05619 [Fulvivirga imtechensis AK7]|uniref:N-acetyltransferase domain-containing protein n=1 Tax=Fulvivirga imtechensis AK7 TaxID=1237149 RepID=L8JJ50_9BACT|nr:GNAT family N-acetyltransferase [Fulvivirga imtechensis]ELR68926.1 hypothetical protein C900_05619 [Fulvivirga imtechensis AK7]
MTIQHKEIKNKGKFYIEHNDVEIALIAYTLSAQNQLTINHTEVNPDYSGQGIASRLISSTVNYVREKGYKITPECSYAAAVFAKKQEFSDVLRQ